MNSIKYWLKEIAIAVTVPAGIMVLACGWFYLNWMVG